MCVQSNTFCFSVHMCGPVTSYMRAVQKTRKYFWGVKKKKRIQRKENTSAESSKARRPWHARGGSTTARCFWKKTSPSAPPPRGFYVLEKLFGSPPDVGSGPFLYTYLPPAADRSWKRTLKIPVRCVQRESTCRISVCLYIYIYIYNSLILPTHACIPNLTVSTYI